LKKAPINGIIEKKLKKIDDLPTPINIIYDIIVKAFNKLIIKK